MSYQTVVIDPPQRLDLSMRTNNHELITFQCLRPDGTPMEIIDAAATLAFEMVKVQPNYVWSDTGWMNIARQPPAERHVITSAMAPNSPGGWIDATGFPTGVLRIHLPPSMWKHIHGRKGNWDTSAMVGGIQQCLARGEFLCESAA